MRLRCWVSKANAPLLLVGVAQDADEHDRRMQVAGDIHIVDRDQPASLTGNSRRITSPISRFSSSRTRCSRREDMFVLHPEVERTTR